ncbi:MAG: putative tricarboxylic transport rane protein [Microbacteriaceae bacterium]|jgi:putative tricarboxylic transport membrane protein|nr:putative tricarboxylic transport rane protein [Microbacteriaceae bacterium]
MWKLSAAAAAVALTLTACSESPGASAPEESKAAEVVALGRVEIIAPAAPGSGWDQTARAVQSALEAGDLVDSATVTNVPGASGTVALAQFAPQEGKKDTLIASGLAMMSGVLTNATEVTLDDLTPIARLIGDNEMIVVPEGSPYDDLDALFAAIKKDPKSVAIAGGSAGSADQIFIGLLAQEYGVKPSEINYVPFSGGGEATTALLGKQVDAGVAGVGEFIEQVKAGQLTGLVTSSSEAVADIDVPTIADAGHPDMEFFNWRSIMAPPGITEEETTAYISALTTMSESEEWATTMEQNSWIDLFLTGDEFGDWLDEENERVSGVLQDLGLSK